MLGDERADREVVKLASIVYLEGEDGALELSLDISIKCREHANNFGFVAKREGPNIMSAAINYN